MATFQGSPIVPPETPPQKTSRYRTLRSKSISSRFNVSRDSDATDSPPLKIRSSSVAGSRSRSPSVCLSKAPPLPTTLPPIPNFVLSANPKNDFSPPLTVKLTPQDSIQLPSSSSSTKSSTALVAAGRSKLEGQIEKFAVRLDVNGNVAGQHKEDELRLTEQEQAARYADEVARLEAETDRILAEQRKLDLARLQVQPSTPPSQRARRVILEKLNLFSRSRKSTTPSKLPPGTPSTIAPTIFTTSSSRASSIESPPPPDRMSFIDMGSKGDAPISASNGGERRVTVRCLSSTISLEVTAETTTLDILKAAAAQTRHAIDVETSVVIECYFVLGLERRLRRYEHVRDALNSWDRDQENSLLIMTGNDLDNNHDLDASSVPRTDDPAYGFTIQLYHSSRPGKWNKRFVTLLNNGQIFASKRADSKVSDKDSTSLCHLSDFDIYKPKESELRRNLKPPKKYCFAIKSQQKTIVFSNGENFVHFFSMEDAQVAERFFQLVHAWRSWYLVNNMIITRAPENAPKLDLDMSTSRKESKNGGSRHGTGDITTGSFINDSDFTNAIEQSTKKLTLDTKRHRSVSKRGPSASSASASMKSEQEFAPSGLLGEAYNKRREEAEAATDVQNTKAEKADSPFTHGPSLLNSIIVASPETEQPESTSWFPSATEHTARNRVQSVSLRRPVTSDANVHHLREKGPQPLLNFSGDFPEAPRSRDPLRSTSGSGPGSRRGHGLRTPAGSPLINFATGGPPGDRLGPPPSNGPPPPPNMRGRSRSTIGPNPRRFPPMEDLPLIPPMSHRSVSGPRPNRAPPQETGPRSRDQRRHDRPPHRGPARPQERRTEPLVNHAR